MTMSHYIEIATSSATPEWATPPEVFHALNLEFGPFDLDVCAAHTNAKCSRFFTEYDDGLAQRWTGRVWMNPPYGRTISQWMNKARQSATENDALVVCLVPARPDTRWWRDSTASAAVVRFYPGRLRFGDIGCPAPFPSALIVFGQLHRRHGHQPVQCRHCHDWFWPARTDAKTCSPRCRQAQRRSQIKRTSVTKSNQL